jgi:succinate dehydrogenase cytochrome b556 subunit
MGSSDLTTTKQKNISFSGGGLKAALLTCAKFKGWPFIIAWAHRITGVVLVVYLWFHIATLSFLAQPAAYDSKMKIFQNIFFVFMEWLLAVPVVFHALNGGRLILYESFGVRKNETLIGWVLICGALYTVLLGVMMLLGSQSATALFYWLTILALCAGVGYPVFAKIWPTRNAWPWKLQRLTGAFLLVAIPAHLLFMHLNAAMGHEAGVVIARMQNVFIKTMDVALVVFALYHGGYGLLSILKDYVQSKTLQQIWAALIALIMILFGGWAVKLTLMI